MDGLTSNIAKNALEKGEKEEDKIDGVFNYTFDRFDYKLTFLEQKAIDEFQKMVTLKGYIFSIEEENMVSCSKNPHYRYIITVK